LKDETTGVQLGRFTLDETGKLTVIFNGEGTNLSVREGTIKLETELKVTTDVEKIEIVTGIKDEDGEVITITLPIAKADIQKSGVINAENTVIWSIVANKNRLTLKNAIIKEYLPEGLKVWYTNYYIQNESGNWETAPEGFIHARQTSSSTYEYSFPSGELTVPIKIELKMTIADKDKTEFLNKVEISGDNFLPNSSEATVSFNQKDNYKKLNDYDLDSGILNWEVKATFTQESGIFKDWMYVKTYDPNTATHHLKEGSIQVFDESGNKIPDEDWEFADADSKDYAKKEGKYVHFTLNFKKKGIYTIKYSTEAFEKPMRPGTGAANFGTVIDGESKEELTGGETVKVNGKLGVLKEAYNKNNTDSTVEYKITINSNKLLMKNVIITDRFDSLNGGYPSALQLLEDTLKLSSDSKPELDLGIDYQLERLDGDANFKTGFRIKLIGNFAETSEKIVLKYKAKYFIDEQEKNPNGAASLRFDNSVIVSYTGEDGKNHTDGDDVAFWGDSKLSYNGVKYGVYAAKNADLTTKFTHANPFDETKAPEDSVYWSAVFNTWKTKIPANTIIREALGEGETLRDIVIYDVELAATKVEVGSLGAKWVKGEDYEVVYDGDVPEIKLLKDKTNPFSIFVSAAASEEVYKYKNVATMTIPNNKPLVVEGMVEKSEKTAWIDKDGTQGTDKDYRLINWTVILNKDGHKVIQPLVEDTVNVADQTFVYDEDKNVVVKVYKAKSDGQGGFEKDGEAIVFDEGNQPFVTTDSAEGTQKLTIKLGDSINSPYIVEYQTMLDPDIKNHEKVSNSATLFGKDVSIHETSKEVIVKSTNGEGTSSGKNGSLKFKKLDENKELIKTKSAFFDLYRKDKEGNLTLMMSDIEVKGDKIIENGVEIDQLSRLRYGTYVIVESKAPEGYVKNENKHEFTISSEQINYVFKLENRKIPDKLSTKLELEAKKELDGRPLKADEFSFTLKGDGGVDQTKKNAADGKVIFDEITYDKAGIYEYTISEAIPIEKETGVTYDDTKYKVTVTVEEKAGKLEATAVYENIKAGEVPTFKNTYKALPGTIQLEAKKEISGRTLKADEFSFTLKGVDGVDQTKKNAADGKVIFDEIPYDKAGIYEYTISEAIPTEKETGVTYDDTKYKVTVTVEEKAGKLEATAVYENIKAGEVPTFKNTYKALPGTVQLEAKKELSGRTLKADEFSFTLKGDGGVDQTKKNDKDGKVLFDAITYDQAGTYEYTISEAIPTERETGVTYDDTKYKVTVTVEEKAGKLGATAVYENIKAGEVPMFKNTYKPLPGTIQLEAKKDLSGRPLKADEFSFTLKGDGGVDQTKKNDKDGKVLFDAITYDKAGTYEYTISEVVPDALETGMTYDTKKYEVTVKVVEKDNKLEATATYKDVTVGEVPTFKNTYKALPGTIQLEAKKELSGRLLKSDEFSFTLKGDGGVDQTKKNDKDGKVLFDAITYDQAGTYEYTISEKIPAVKETGVTYDDTKYKVTVTVEEKAGKLEATAVYETGEVPTFKNAYKALPGSIQLEAKKELDGRSLKADEFSFNLKGDNVDQMKKNNADGKILFDQIDYDQAGTYEYTISEMIPADKETGLTYDEVVYKVTVTVVEEAGKLKAKVDYESLEAGEIPTFKNMYKALPGSIQLEAKKELDGRSLKADEFSFNLKGDNVDQTKKNAADGKVTFDEITYDQAGTYEYTISEAIPTAKETGITYDDTQYKVSVKVEENAGMLEAVATYENLEDGELPVFRNLYTPEKEVPTGELLLKKIDSKTGRTLANAEFKLVDDKGQVVTGKEKIVTGEDGSIFIKGLADGEYQIIETKAPDGYLIDETPIKFSVKNNQPSKKEINQENDPLKLPETGNSSNKTTNVKTTYRNATGKRTTVSKRLPSTGSIQSKGLVILGLFFLAMFGLVVFGKRKNI
jgi:pilin isopeptide linkage protein/LPXTG-motif cell wall-anchored protein